MSLPRGLYELLSEASADASGRLVNAKVVYHACSSVAYR